MAANDSLLPIAAMSPPHAATTPENPNITAVKDSTSTATTPRGSDNTRHSRLLELPAELRNQIYRLSLVSAEKVPVNPTFWPPPLLQVNKQIRGEAAPIFYCENRFSVLCLGYSCRLVLLFRDVVYATDPTLWGKVQRTVNVGGQQMVWSNVEHWVEQWFHGKIRGIKSSRAEGLRTLAVSRAFDLAETFIDKVEWRIVKEMLAAYKVAAEEQANGNWKWS